MSVRTRVRWVFKEESPYRYRKGEYDWRTGWPVMFMFGCIIFGTLLLGLVGRQVDHGMRQDACAEWARVNPSLEVEFVDLNYFDYRCLSRTDNGIMVDVDNWRAIVEGVGSER